MVVLERGDLAYWKKNLLVEKAKSASSTSIYVCWNVRIVDLKREKVEEDSIPNYTEFMLEYFLRG